MSLYEECKLYIEQMNNILKLINKEIKYNLDLKKIVSILNYTIEEIDSITNKKLYKELTEIYTLIKNKQKYIDKKSLEIITQNITTIDCLHMSQFLFYST